MLVVKIELWPFGDSSRKKELGYIEIWNTGKKSDKGDEYAYHVGGAYNLEGKYFLFKNGFIKNYNRWTKPVYCLLFEVLKKALKNVK